MTVGLEPKSPFTFTSSSEVVFTTVVVVEPSAEVVSLVTTSCRSHRPGGRGRQRVRGRAGRRRRACRGPAGGERRHSSDPRGQPQGPRCRGSRRSPSGFSGARDRGRGGGGGRRARGDAVGQLALVLASAGPVVAVGVDAARAHGHLAPALAATGFIGIWSPPSRSIWPLRGRSRGAVGRAARARAGRPGKGSARIRGQRLTGVSLRSDRKVPWRQRIWSSWRTIVRFGSPSPVPSSSRATTCARRPTANKRSMPSSRSRPTC